MNPTMLRSMMIILRILIAVLAAAIIMPSAVDAQGGDLDYGDQVTGYLVSGLRDSWTFEGQAGDAITITMSANFDTFLELYGPEDQEIAINDDFDGLNSQIGPLELPEDGMYTIIARGYRRSAFGSYTLTLNQTQMAAANLLVIDDAIESTIRAGGRDEWTFEAEAGEVVIIEMEGDFDTFVELIGPDDSTIALNNDAVGGGSRLGPIRLPESGTYTIIARGVNRREFGDYSLTLEASALPSTVSIDYGETVDAVLERGAQDRWTFQGSAGDIVTIDMTARFDTYLLLIGPSSEQVTFDDDSGTGRNARIDAFILPADGMYTIVARGYNSSASGPYTLRLFVQTDA